MKKGYLVLSDGTIYEGRAGVHLMQSQGKSYLIQA